MSPILTLPLLIKAKQAVAQMSMDDKLAWMDEIHDAQPNLLLSILSVHKTFGASPEQTEALLNLLLETWLAMKASNRRWPLISEEMLCDNLERLIAKMRFADNLSNDLFNQAINQHIRAHAEPNLLARVHMEILDQGWIPIKDDQTQRVLLVGLNLVECVADASKSMQRQTPKKPPLN